jgi:hypothetical protein
VTAPELIAFPAAPAGQKDTKSRSQPELLSYYIYRLLCKARPATQAPFASVTVSVRVRVKGECRGKG